MEAPAWRIQNMDTNVISEPSSARYRARNAVMVAPSRFIRLRVWEPSWAVP
ncbi:hypothetical protein D3C73_1552880 [compost metagenome]